MSKRASEQRSILAVAAIAATAACLFALLLCLLLAAAASTLDDPTAYLGLYGALVFALSALLSGLLGARLAARERFLGGMLAGGILIACTIAASFAFADGSFTHAAVLCGIGAFLVSVGALLGAKERKRRRRA